MKKLLGLSALGFAVALTGCIPEKLDSSSEAAKSEIHRVDITPNPAYQPTLHVVLPDSCPVPDGMTVEESTGKVFLNVPNFAPSNPDGSRQFPA